MTVVLVEVTRVVTGVVMGILAEPVLFPWRLWFVDKGSVGRRKGRGGNGKKIVCEVKENRRGEKKVKGKGGKMRG